MTTSRQTFAFPLVAIISVVVLVTGVLFLWPANQVEQDNTQGYPTLGGDFTLQSAEGPVSLADYRGKVVVLYFGYTYCPDVCPTSLGLLSLALGKLTQDELNNLKVFFISVDPERDTVDKLKSYASAFHPAISGITGTAEQVARVAKQYGVIYMKVEMPDSALGYAVDHSSRYYVVGRDGKVKNFIEHGTSPDEIVKTLRQVLTAK